MSFTDIFEAVQKGTIEDVKFYIEKKDIDVNVRTKEGLTPLFAAVSIGNIEVAKYLISVGADVNLRSNVGMPPLFFAVAIPNRDIDIIKLLVSAGADVTAKFGEYDWTALRQAESVGTAEIVRYLSSLDAG